MDVESIQDGTQDDRNRGGAAPRSRPWTWLSWFIIVLICTAMIILPSMMTESEPHAESALSGIMTLQSKVLVGAAELTNDEAAVAKLAKEAEALNIGPLGQRQRFVILMAELKDVESAAAHLRELDELLAEHRASGGESTSSAATDRTGEEAESGNDGLNKAQLEVQALLRTLYLPEEARTQNQPNTAALGAAQKETLREELGWFGKLALAHPSVATPKERTEVIEPAEAAATSAVVFGLLALLALVAGGIGLIVMVTLAILGSVRSGFGRINPSHGIYAETFAVWLILFLGLQVVSGALASFSPEASLASATAAFFLSLVALRWPVLRGLPWSEVRRDLGLTFGARPWLEPFLGLAGYMMALPILVVGLLLTLGLMAVQQFISGEGPAGLDAGGMPMHPIVEVAATGGWGTRLLILLVGSVAAPIVEEIMFRGVLYRHLRDSSRGLGLIGSIVLSVALTGFIFAAIHPQGWVAIPALMSLATAFALMREWRDTVLPSIIMHAVSNGIVLSLLMAVFAT